MPTKRRIRAQARDSQEVVSGETTVRVITSKNPITDEVYEERHIHKFISEPAYVRVGAGVTKNMGDYESLRVDVSITMPCYPEHVDELYPILADKVADRLSEEVSQYIENTENDHG